MQQTGRTVAGALFASFLIAPVAAQAADSYGFDKNHTEIMFIYDHLGISKQSGRFVDYDGVLVFDQEDPAKSSIEVTIKAASLETDVAALDDHLKSGDFFDVESFPEITFKSTEVRKTSPTTGQVVGDLTIKDKTKPVVLDVTFNFAGVHPLSAFNENYKDAQYAGFSARTTVLRSDFGVDLYAPLTSDTIDVVIETELRKNQ